MLKKFLFSILLVFSIPVTAHDSGTLATATYSDVISSKEARAIKPWLLPASHPMKARLDAIFMATRAIQDKTNFAEAGFETLKVQPRSYIRVARHSDLPGYLLKVYLDNELRLKKNKPGWYWFVKRCEGANRIGKIISKKKMHYFKVAKKWIYRLPKFPLAPVGSEYKAKGEILLVEDMNIVSDAKSRVAWKKVMTKAHLDELYVIISHGGGRSYRPDNIPYSHDGKFAFIDTEYPDTAPDYSVPLKYFSAEMAAYWKKLIKQGGP